MAGGLFEAMSRDVEILIVHPTQATILAELPEIFGVHRLWETTDPEALLARVGPKIRALVVNGRRALPDAMLDQLPNLEIIAAYGVGYDGVDAVAAARRGIVVTNTPGVADEEVADVCVGLLLGTIRELPQADRHLRSGAWQEGSPYRLTASLRGRTVGIWGLGRIGKAAARRLAGFNIRICYCGRSRQPDVPYEYVPTLMELARQVDTLICMVPGGDATRHAVNAEVLQALGPNGILINIGRGSTVDESALVAALASGGIHAAGLDVFENEPNVTRQLMEMDNVVLSPHIGTGTYVTREAMARLVIDNVVDWFDGRPPRTPVPECAILKLHSRNRPAEKS
jgi:lactate dehydrogenase-like 2-hydroxyacid dehydrogenase